MDASRHLLHLRRFTQNVHTGEDAEGGEPWEAQGIDLAGTNLLEPLGSEGLRAPAMVRWTRR